MLCWVYFVSPFAHFFRFSPRGLIILLSSGGYVTPFVSLRLTFPPRGQQDPRSSLYCGWRDYIGLDFIANFVEVGSYFVICVSQNLDA